jgi:hypothetical protein
VDFGSGDWTCNLHQLFNLAHLRTRHVLLELTSGTLTASFRAFLLTGVISPSAIVKSIGSAALRLSSVAGAGVRSTSWRERECGLVSVGGEEW